MRSELSNELCSSTLSFSLLVQCLYSREVRLKNINWLEMNVEMIIRC